MRKPYIGPSESQSAALAARSRPYAIDHARSIQKRQSPPRDLLGWFIAGYRSEMPDAIHRTSGVWRDRVTQHEAGQGLQAVGGSLLGTLPNDELFRRFVEDGPFACEIAEYEGHKDRNPHYLFPMRAALARLASSKTFMARVLQRIAILDGDVEGAMIAFGIIPAIQHDYLEAALYRLWTKYDAEPPARILPRKDVAA